jgi:hypothetical protein
MLRLNSCVGDNSRDGPTSILSERTQENQVLNGLMLFEGVNIVWCELTLDP